MIINKALESSMINAVEYDVAQHILTVEFQDGSEYEYYDFPHDLFDDLIFADSHGKFFHQYIKGEFKYNKIN